MAYIDLEEAVDTGQPIELFLFENLEEQFTYTSGQETVTYSGRNYVPEAMKRSSPEIQSTQTDRRIVIETPINNDFALRYVTTLPASPDHVTIYRFHSTDGGSPEVEQYFTGEVVNVAFVEDRAKINCVSNARILDDTIPKQTCRNLCNHVLYDIRCSVVQALFTTATVVTDISISGLRVTLYASGLSALSATDYFNAGVLSRNSIENRMVMKTEDLGADSVTFDILLPFQILEVGSVLNISAGCSHGTSICKSRFNNIRRYGGFPFIPHKNPFGQVKVTGGS